MLDNIRIPELLSPAGSWDSLYAAVNNGCDAIYLGGKHFSARSSANNFTDDELRQAIDFCHLRQVKVYIAVNTLFKNTELASVFKFISDMYVAGVDAFIVQDVGTAHHIRQNFPDVRLHASTQMTVGDAAGVHFLAQAGFDRVVLNRELSLDSISAISESVPLELEVFVHGALCVCYSGQCLMSSMLGGRSGNRGKCAQPCRLQYTLCKDEGPLEKGYLLSPKDMMTLDILPELVGANVSCLKIEGRMKSPEYVGLVTKTYRDQLDKIKAGRPFVASRDVERLSQVFNRGGAFTTGYYKQYAGLDMMSTQTPKSTGVLVGSVAKYSTVTKHCVIELVKDLHPGDGIEIWTNREPHVGTNINRQYRAMSKLDIDIEGDISPGNRVYLSYDKQLIDELKQLYTKDTRKMQITCTVKAVVGEPLKIILRGHNQTVALEGERVERAQNQPLTSEKLLEQVGKSGDTPFTLQFESCQIDSNLYIGISKINALRREALAQFAQVYAQSFKRPLATADISLYHSLEIPSKRLTVLVSRLCQLEKALSENVSVIYVEMQKDFLAELDHCINKAKRFGVKLCAALPRFDDETDVAEQAFALLEKSSIDGYLIRTYGQLQALKRSSKYKTLDSTFNVLNGLSLGFLSQSADVITLSPELTFHEINRFATPNSEIVVHGRQPLMITRQCPVGLYAARKNSGKFCALKHQADRYTLKDRKNMSFPIMTDCDRCGAVVLNSQLLFTLNKIGDLLTCIPGYVRLSFTTESPEEVANVIQAYDKRLHHDETDSTVTDVINNCTAFGVTNGHFYRGTQ